MAGVFGKEFYDDLNLGWNLNSLIGVMLAHGCLTVVFHHIGKEKNTREYWIWVCDKIL